MRVHSDSLISNAGLRSSPMRFIVEKSPLRLGVVSMEEDRKLFSKTGLESKLPILIAGLALIAVLAAYSEKNQDGKLLGLFHAVPWSASKSVSAEAENLIQSCCKKADAAVQLLQESGFKVTRVSSPEEVERLNRAHDQSRRNWPPEDQIEFDEFVSGSRGAGWRFWRMLSRYEVTLFIKNDEVERVRADVSTVLP